MKITFQPSESLKWNGMSRFRSKEFYFLKTYSFGLYSATFGSKDGLYFQALLPIYSCWNNNLCAFLFTIVCIHHLLFIHLFIDRYLPFFHLLAVVNIAAMNIGVQVSFAVSVFNCFGYVSRSWIAVHVGIKCLRF